MNLLVLGGTRFLGRHIVDVALARGHDVTVFTRGKNAVPWGARVAALAGDRDPAIAPGLAALERRSFDAVVDTSGYVPRVVGASAALLEPRVARYLFVSSLSVYAHPDRPGLDETARVAVLDDPSTEDVLAYYGALKVACEAAVTQSFGGRATHVRPGLIVGPYDATDRFGYWVARFLLPELLGRRPTRAVVPAPRERPIQFIDARDLAAWIVDLLERDVGGTFNAASPRGQWTMGDLIDTLGAAGSASPKPAWIDDALLVQHHVAPWIGLPLWLPPEPDGAGFLAIDCAKAQRAGLATRALTQTIADTGAWLAARDNAGAWQHVLGGDQERAILAHAA